MATKTTKTAPASDAPEAPPQYRVTGGLITVRTAGLAGIVPGRGGYVMVSLYAGSILPSDVPAESIERHLAEGLIERVTP